MHILAQEFISVLIAQGAKTGWVAERAAAFEINPINSLGSRVENQPEFILALTQVSLGRSLPCTPPQEFENEKALREQ